MTGPEPLLSIRDLSFTYDGAVRPALQGISLDVKRGEMILLCGPTGCGKTSLALCLNALAPFATGGHVTGSITVGDIEATESTTPHMATDVGLVFQDPEGQMCTLFLEDEIAFGPENLLVPRELLSVRVEEMLELVGLTHRRFDSVFELSGGQKQKVNIASVLAMRPRLLVCDMPTANLDPAGSAGVFALLRALASSDELGCLLSENRLDDLAPLADRVLVMDHSGALAYDGIPTDVFANGRDIMERLGVEIPQTVELALALRERGFPVGRGTALPLTTDEMTAAVADLLAVGCLSPSPAAPPAPHTPPAPADNPVVELDDVHFSYGKGPEVLKGVSFSMQRGELLAIVGNNGSGKTTLAKQLIGLLKPTRGRGQVCGQELRRATVEQISRHAAYVFQYPEHQFVAQGQTVYDEVAFNLRTAGLPESEIVVRVADLLNRFELADKAQTSPFSLSGGEMRTLSVACMLSTNPELLLLDEPTYGQDRRRIRALMQRLAELRATGTSVIMISHDMRLVAEYASSVLLLSHGEVLYRGAPAGLFQRPDLLAQAALKEPPTCAMARGLRELGIYVPEDAITVESLLASLAGIPITA